MKKISLNMLMSVICKIVTIVSGIIVQRYILLAFGSLYNGLSSSISQIMSYLALLEAGLGAASIQALYQPLAQKNWKDISGIFNATGKEYKKITGIFVILLLGVSFLLPVFVAKEVEFRIAALFTFVTGAGSILAYIVGGKYKAVLTADQKIYVLYLWDTISVVLSCVFRIAALKCGQGIIVVQLINFLTIGIKNVGYVIYVKSKYKEINSLEEPAYHLIGKRWNVLVHNLAGMVVTHTDVLILTIFSSLKTVSVYSIYNMIFGQVSSFLTSTFSQAPLATFGILLNNNFNEFKRKFHLYEQVYTLFLFVIGTFFTIVALPFVSIYTNGVSDTNYRDGVLPILFGIILIMNQLRTPATIAINASGSFRETQKGAVIEAVLNIVVSMVLFVLLPEKQKIYGLLLGTVCSYLYRTTDVLIYSYKDILKDKMSIITKSITVNSLTSIVAYVIYLKFIHVEVTTFLFFMTYAIVVFLGLLVLFLIVNCVFNHKIMMDIFQLANSILKKIRGGQK